VLLIDELEEIVEALEQLQFDAIAVPIHNRIGRCSTSCSSQFPDWLSLFLISSEYVKRDAIAISVRANFGYVQLEGDTRSCIA
jgi:hypothetical protein